jgi:hypothetical protein
MAHATIDGGGGGPDAAFAAETTPPAALSWKKAGWAALQLFAGGGLLALIGIFLASKIDGRLFSTCCAIVPTAVFATGFLRGLHALYLLVRARGRGFNALGASVIALPVLAGGFFTLVGTFLTMWSTTGFSRGRQLRKGSKLLLPPVAAGDGWDTTDLRAAAPVAIRSDLAGQWRENGRTEHASVAAFARLTLNLIALGAPSSLIESANRDSLDEIRHAQLCFSLARSLDGRSQSPGPFPEAQHAGALSSFRTLALAELAVSSLIDGALHEGISARVLARLTRRCEDPVTREMIRALAADEGRHAAHGWDVVEWCLAKGGDPVARSLLAASRAIPDQIHYSLDEQARDGSWEAHGIPGERLESEEHAKARAHLLEQVERITAKQVQRAA